MLGSNNLEFEQFSSHPSVFVCLINNKFPLPFGLLLRPRERVEWYSLWRQGVLVLVIMKVHGPSAAGWSLGQLILYGSAASVCVKGLAQLRALVWASILSWILPTVPHTINLWKCSVHWWFVPHSTSTVWKNVTFVFTMWKLGSIPCLSLSIIPVEALTWICIPLRGPLMGGTVWK